MKKDVSQTAFACKKVKAVYLVDADEKDLMRSKRIFEMLDLAEEVFTFNSANEALQSMNKPGLVPEIMIVSEQMSDTDIKGFMQRYQNLPAWLTNACTVYQLLPPISIETDSDTNFNHELLRSTMHKPFCAQQLNGKTGSIDEFLN